MIEEIISKYEKKAENVLLVLEDIQSRYNYLSEENLKTVAKEFDLPISRVYSLATFYKSFSLKPKGRHHICVCTGTACHVRGATRIIDEIERKLNIKSGETRPDGLYSLETVNCLGACALGPLVVIDGQYHGKMTSSKITKLLDQYK